MRAQEVDPYAAAWAGLARRRAVAGVAIASAITTLVVSFLEIAQLGKWPEYALAPMGIVALATLFGPVYFRCPRCNERFGRGTAPDSDNPFARVCKHCGLPAGTPEADAASFPLTRDPYLVAWRRLEGRTRRGKWALAGWTVALLAAGWAPFHSTGAPAAIFAGATLLALLFIGAEGAFVCPRCAKPFFAGEEQSSAQLTRCAHCGLDVGAPRGPTR